MYHLVPHLLDGREGALCVCEYEGNDMSSQQIEAENLGPIEHVKFSIDGPGVTVLVAPNGTGKSILLDAVASAARGKGKLPLRDRTKRGSVSAFGCNITIGASTRYTGQFEVQHIEGRFDLATLVDPQIKSPVAADKARIKALVMLTGVEADRALFERHQAFSDFTEVVPSDATTTDDLVDMASRVKQKYDAAALLAERAAVHQRGQAASLKTDMDLSVEHDAVVLRQAYDAAHDRVVQLKHQQAAADEYARRIATAKSVLQNGSQHTIRDSIRDAKTSIENNEQNIATTRAEKDAVAAQIAELQRRQAELVAHEQSLASKNYGLKQQIAVCERQLEELAVAERAVAAVFSPPPSDEEMAQAVAAEAAAAAQMERGHRVREAIEKEQRAASYRTEAEKLEQKAARYRDAAKATDEVLSLSIDCKHLRVESDGDSARLVTDTARGPGVAYHELSEGERWKIAIDIGADQVGKGGLLVISQVGWEGIDGRNRRLIHDHAVQREVYILTAEAASDPDARREIVAQTLTTHREQSDTQQVAVPAKNTTPTKQPAVIVNRDEMLSDADDIPF